VPANHGFCAPLWAAGGMECLGWDPYSVAQAMGMKTVKSTIVPFEELL
jgi:hypothetical protein